MDNASDDPVKIISAHAAAGMKRPPDNLATPVIVRHGVETEFYAPVGTDRQTPHDRDELYFIARGAGWFSASGQRRRIGVGDMLFVPAHAEHRFDDFTDDFATWVVFFGPAV